MDDSKIIELFFERSERAITELSRKYGALCLKTANNVLSNGSDAEECVNDALLAVWNTIPPANPSSLISYICRITRNLAIKRYRSNTAAKRCVRYDVCLDELSEILHSNETVENELAATEIAAEINRFLMKCKSTDRVIFTRRYFFSEGISEIAELIGKTDHYVSVRLHRTKIKLKKYLLEKGITV